MPVKRFRSATVDCHSHTEVRELTQHEYLWKAMNVEAFGAPSPALASLTRWLLVAVEHLFAGERIEAIVDVHRRH